MSQSSVTLFDSSLTIVCTAKPEIIIILLILWFIRSDLSHIMNDQQHEFYQYSDRWYTVAKHVSLIPELQ